VTAHHGKRQAIYRATMAGTAVTCESCGRQVVVRGPVSKVVDSLGWWRADHDLILCDECYVEDGDGDEEHKCADCFGVFTVWSETAPGFRLCVECSDVRIREEGES